MRLDMSATCTQDEEQLRSTSKFLSLVMHVKFMTHVKLVKLARNKTHAKLVMQVKLKYTWRT
jgi:hypothetical protein